MSVTAAKLVGMAVLILGLVVYCLLVMVLAVNILPDNRFVALLFYIFAGTVWVLPARWIVIRINRDADEGDGAD